MIKIHFDRSDDLAETLGLGAGVHHTIAYPANEGHWVQLTLDTLRTQDGAVLAAFDDDGVWHYDDQPWSDVIIEFIPNSTPSR